MKKLKFVSYSLCVYSELFVFPLDNIGVPLFLPHQTDIYQETILAPKTCTASLLSVFIKSMTLESLL